VAKRCLRRAYRIRSHDPARTPFEDQRVSSLSVSTHLYHIFNVQLRWISQSQRGVCLFGNGHVVGPLWAQPESNLRVSRCRRGRSCYLTTPTISKSLRVGYKGPSTVLYGCTLSVKLTEDHSPTSCTSPSSPATRTP